MPGRKRIYKDARDRRQHVRPIGVSVATKARLKSQARYFGIPLISYMDILSKLVNTDVPLSSLDYMHQRIERLMEDNKK